MAGKKEATEEAQGALVERPAAPLALLSDMESHAGHGMEETTSEDIKIPFLKMMQGLSPECSPGTPEYMGGAVKAGDVLNSITGEVFECSNGDTFRVVLCHYRREIVRWGMREKGGGFKERFSPEQAAPLLKACTVDDKRRHVEPGGETHLEETGIHYVLLESGERAVIAMPRSALNASRTWNTLAVNWSPEGWTRDAPPPSYGRFYEISAKPKSNSEGQTWMTWNIVAGDLVTPDLFRRAAEFHEIVKLDSESLDLSDARDSGTDPADVPRGEAA